MWCPMMQYCFLQCSIVSFNVQCEVCCFNLKLKKNDWYMVFFNFFRCLATTSDCSRMFFGKLEIGNCGSWVPIHSLWSRTALHCTVEVCTGISTGISTGIILSYVLHASGVWYYPVLCTSCDCRCNECFVGSSVRRRGHQYLGTMVPN